ncbi:hypothetical protein C3369_15100 [Escherichia sp. ESNIH1]|nr:hypothetical protein C3369_15100 [Escherichia sp. ESNIH1]
MSSALVRRTTLLVKTLLVWQMEREMLSPRNTTWWSELLILRAN